MSKITLTQQFAHPPEVHLYIRMSTTEQLNGDSLRRQREAGTEYARKNGLNLPIEHIMEDIGLSAFNGENVTKGKLGIFIRDVESGKVPKGSILLVESTDRLSRQDEVSGLLLHYTLINRGIVIITLDDGAITDKASSDLSSIINFVAKNSRSNQESALKSERVSKAWAQKRINAPHKKLTRRCPSWLTLNADSTEFQIIPARAAVLHRIARAALFASNAVKVQMCCK